MDKTLSDFELYKLFRGEYVDAFTLHKDALQHYLAFTTGILVATIAGILQIFGKGWFGLIILVGSILNTVACILAINMCNRYYVGVLERITILSKLESRLGLQDQINSRQKKKANIFSDDLYFLPERWINGTDYSTSSDFIKGNLNKGVNRVARQSFHFLILINIVLAIAIFIISLQ